MRIRHLNRVYEVLSDINKTMVREKDPQTMLEEACRITVETGEFRMAWIGIFDDTTQKVQPVASAGVVEGYLDLVNIDLRDKERSSGPAGRCFVSGEHVTCSDIERDPLMAPWREEALRRGYRSYACFPLKVRAKVTGIFTLYSDKAEFFDEEELRLFDELALDVGFALEVSEGETKRGRAERELRWRTAFFEAQVYSAIDGILVVDSEGRKLLQNRRMNELWNIPAAIADDPDDSKQLQFVLGEVKEPEAFSEKIAYLYSHPDESSREEVELLDGKILERYSAPVRGSDGKYYGRVWTFHDITERKSMEEQFLRSQRMESVGLLASGIAHDLNNVLSPILMCADLLEMSITDESSKSLIETIETSARRGADIVRQVLTFASGIKGARVAVQMKHLVAEMAKIASETFPRNITIRPHYTPDLPNVPGDPTQLHQVVINLCVNARDAMPGGGTLTMELDEVLIEATYAASIVDAKPGRYVRLSIIDTGSGISKQVLDRIFEPFFTTKEQGKGTGLGLSTVIGIVRSHAGFITVETQPGKGTTFRVHLPVSGEEPAIPTNEPVRNNLRGRGESILIVDDELSIRKVTAELLNLHGYQTLTASEGVEAICLLAKPETKVDLVVTDIMMPGMDGALLVKTVRRLNPNIRFIVVSGLGESTSLSAQMESLKGDGVAEVLSKPISSDSLLKAVRKTLDAVEN